MSDLSSPIELKLQEAARFIKAGQKNQARQLWRDILISDYDCLKAWELLVYATYNIARLPAATKKGGGLSLWHNSGLKSGTKPATTSHYVTDRPWTPF